MYLSSVSASLTPPWPGLGAYAVSKAALDKLVEAWRAEHPGVNFTRCIVGDCGGGDGESATGFADNWDWDLLGELHRVWTSADFSPERSSTSSTSSRRSTRCFVEEPTLTSRRSRWRRAHQLHANRAQSLAAAYRHRSDHAVLHERRDQRSVLAEHIGAAIATPVAGVGAVV